MDLSQNAAGRASIMLIVSARLLPVADTETQVSPTTPATSLALLAGRGELQKRWSRADLTAATHNVWQRALLDTLGLARTDYPSAAVTALGDDQSDMSGYWLHADLVHLAAGMDSLTFAPLSDATAVSAMERETLAALVATHFEATPLRLRAGAAGNWLIQSSRELDVLTASPDAATANEFGAVMPSGADARELRRLLTEWQMVLHEHPLNERRQRRGLPAINAIWPWGGGSLKPVAHRALPAAFADDAFTRGVWRMQGASVRPLPPDAEALISDAAAGTVVIVAATDTQLESQWLAPLVGALRAGRLSQLDIVIDGWHLRATRGMLRRFWRKPLLPSGWTR